MSNRKHMWAIFFKRRIKVKACANCSEMNLPSNNENYCESKKLSDSQIIKVGYQMSQRNVMAL